MIEVKKEIEKNSTKEVLEQVQLEFDKKPILIVSYFDSKIGPNILYCNENLDSLKNLDISSFLDILESGTFIFSISQYRSINYIFKIKSDYARGGIETLMISYLIKDGHVNNEYKYLESKNSLLEEFGSEIKKLRDLPEIIHKTRKKENLLESCSKKFKDLFIKLYDTYENKLKSDYKNHLWREIAITCPLCNEMKYLQMPYRIFNKKKEKKKIVIPKYRVCNHEFNILIDENYRVKCFQQISNRIIKEQTSQMNPLFIDIFYIKLNLKPRIIIQALNAFLINLKVIIEIDDDKRLETAILDFFNFIFSDAFKIQLTIKRNRNVRTSALKFENHIAFKMNVINQSKSILNYKFEKEFIYDFFNQTNPISALINLRNRIRELFLLSQSIRDFYLNNGKNRLLSRKRAIHYLENHYFIKLKKDYIDFLNIIIKNYFKVNIRWLHDYIAERIEYMWRKDA
ncbi:MAG: hypothetical protein ACFFBP_14975 [Promethearchaeota archaeon]